MEDSLTNKDEVLMLCTNDAIPWTQKWPELNYVIEINLKLVPR